MKATLAKAQALLNLKTPKTDEAMKLLQPIVNKKNAPWPAFHFSGIAFVQKGEYKMALSFLNEALNQGSDEAETYHAISICYFNMAQYEESEEYANKALERNPEFFKGWLHLGSLYRAQAKLDEALKCFEKANQIDNSSAGVAFRIGEIYNDQGDLNKALELFNITLKINKGYLNAYLAKADILKKQNKYREAEDTIYEVLSLEPRNVPAKVLLAELHKHEGNYEKAIDLYERLIEQYPKMAGARINYALCMQELGNFEESEKNYLQAFEDAPTEFESLSNYLMGLHYNPERTKEEIFEAHKLWDQNFAPAERQARPIPFDTTADKKLRVGFISGGFRTHPVGWMITKALENLPKDQFETYCYTTHNRYDQITKRIHAATDKWQSVIGYDHKVIAKMIREDELDILVELSGHSADTRLKTVVLEPAPVIVKWVGGLFNTTGLKSVDYLITDHQETPAGEENFYTEKLVRMPEDYICFLPPEYAPDVAELPAKEKGYITFGCFNNPTKVNDKILEKWAEIMNRVPNSKLFLKSKQYDTEALRERIIDTMKGCGISEERLKFEGQSPHDELLESYNSVDIALDPWPYSGGLTTCEALWMGVPVITKPGPTFAGRHSTTHLHNAGFSDWIADTWDEYIEKAVDLASDVETLGGIRAGIREIVSNSPVCDGKRFGAHLSKAFRKIWKQRVRGYEENLLEGEWQDHIDVTPVEEDEIDRSENRKDAMEQVKEIEEDFMKKEISEVAQIAQKHSNGNGSSNGHTSHQNEEKKQEEPETYKIKTKNGVTICTPPDLEIMTPYVLLEQNEWYENELDFIRDYLKAGMNFVDVGAGFGVYALPAAKLVGEEGKVFSFEPGAVAKNHLEMSKLENDFQNVEIIGKAVSDKAGKQHWKVGKTPELNKIDESGEEKVQTITLDSWWQFEGEPKVDLLKVDVNGAEANVLTGAKELLESESPVLMISITEQKADAFAKTLQEQEYSLYEYIPGPGILAEHELEVGADPHMQNLIAIPKSKAHAFKNEGWMHDETVMPAEVESELWKITLKELPWTSDLMEKWEGHGKSEGIMNYLQALNYLIAAEKINVKDSEMEQPRSRKAVLLLGAAQILIALYNQGANSTSVVFTLVRTFNALGKRGQAVEVMQKLIETTKFGQENMNVDLPFMLPIPDQDNNSIKTDLPKWLMVKTAEAWILLKDLTTYLSGEQERKLLEVLEGNPEVLNKINRCIAPEKFINRIKPASETPAVSALELKSAKLNGVSKKPYEKLNKVLLVLPGKKGGAHGLHVKFAQRLSEQMKRGGIETEFVHATTNNFLKKVIKASEESGTGIYTGVMGYDLRVSADMNLQGSIFDILNKKAIALLADHPYTQFMWSRLHHAGKNVIYITPYESIKNEYENIYGTVNHVVLLKNPPPLSSNSLLNNVQPIAERDIDLLIPLGLHKHFINQTSISSELSKLGNKAKKVGMETYEAALTDYSGSIFEIFQKRLKENTGRGHNFKGIQRKEDQVWLSVLSTVDWFIRKERRIRLLKGLEEVDSSQKIVITASSKLKNYLPKLQGKNIHWIGEVSSDRLDELYLQSKQVLNSNPTYPDGVHERVRNAMISGAVVISDYSDLLNDTFIKDKGITFVGTDGEGIANYLERSSDNLQQIANRGREIIQKEFSLSGYTERLLKVIADSVLD